MKKTMLSLLMAATTMTMFFTSCKKDDDDSAEVFSSLIDTAGNSILTLTYNSDGKVSRAIAGTTTYDFYYSGSRLIKRTLTESGSLVSTDSFFYDGSDRFSRVDKYNSGGAQTASTVFAYNGDNTINTATVDAMGLGATDQMFEFTYSGGNYATVEEHEKVLGNYNIRRKFEFLAFDSYSNPIAEVIKNYFPDQFNILIFLWSSKNNFTSVTQTDYNVNTGDVTGTFPVSASYKYNGKGMPTEITSTFNGNTNKNFYSYTKL